VGVLSVIRARGKGGGGGGISSKQRLAFFCLIGGVCPRPVRPGPVQEPECFSDGHS
jgi:hypothetical protein